MGTTIQVNNGSAPITLESSDQYYLTAGTVQSGAILDGTSAGTSDILAFINGDFYSFFNLNNSDYAAHVSVGVGGKIISSLGSGSIDISFQTGDGSSLTNNGEIQSGFIRFFNADNYSFSNNGVLSELTRNAVNDSFIVVSAVDDFTFQNTGMVSALQPVFDLYAASDAVFSNSGDIVGQSQIIKMNSSSTARLLNTGSIISQDVMIETAGYVNILNSGHLQAANDIVDSASGVVDFRNNGHITTDGRVIDGSSAVFFQNSGVVDGSGGIFSSNSYVVVENNGLMTTKNSVLAEGATGLFVYNSGQMTANSTDGLLYASVGTFINNGVLNAYSDAVQLQGANVEITNSGDIVGSRGIYANALGSDLTLTNTGTIFGHSLTGVEGFGVSGWRVFNEGTIAGSAAYSGLSIVGATGAHLIKNSGVISGGATTAINISNDSASTAFGHTIVNSGEILGDINLSQGNDVYNGRSGFVSGVIDAGTGDDIITGGEAADVIDGGAGANEIRSLGGDDVITTGDDADFIVSGAGDDDIISGNGDDTIRGGDGEDQINGQGGVDFIQGGNGNDYIRMGNGDGQRGEGNNGDDTLIGGNQKDILLGGADDDYLVGNNGDDVLRGQAGDDELEGGDGNDRLIGNAGTDTAIFSGDSSDYTFTLNGNGTVDVADTVGTDGTDNLFGVELVEFTDGTYLLADLI